MILGKGMAVRPEFLESLHLYTNHSETEALMKFKNSDMSEVRNQHKFRRDWS